MLSTLDRVWFGFGGLLALFVAVRPDQFIRIASYGRARISNVNALLVKAVRVMAAVGVIYLVIWFALDAWSVS
jgi:hypothetical protein